MENKKRILGLLLCIACVLACTVFALTGCGGDSTEETTAPTTESTVTQETTEATTQQTTAPTVETTVTTEETTAPTTSGNDRPGGSGGFEGTGGIGSGGTEETQPTTEATEPVWEVAEPGTAENPYIEVVQLPGSFTTVNMPAQAETAYLIYGAADGVVTIEDADAKVSFAETEYTAVDGVVTLELPKEIQEPLLLKISNQSDAEKSFTVNFAEAFGKESNPYQLELETLPSVVVTPEIGAGQTVYFSVSGAAGATVTVEGENVSIVCGETTYAPQEGVVTAQLPAEEPAMFAIVNGGEAAAVYNLQFAAAEEENVPVQLEQLGELTVSLAAGDRNGNLYQWTATDNGLFSVDIVSTTEGTTCDVILQNQSTGIEAVFSTDAVTHSVTGITKLSIFANTGDVIAMQVIAQPDDAGKVPASEVMLNTVLEGNKDNPIQEFYPGFEVTIPAGKTLYFQAYRLADITATVSGGEFTVVHAGNTYRTGGAEVSFPVVCENMFTPSVFEITNTGAQASVCTVVFAFPVGAHDNPQVLTDAELAQFTVTTAEGNDQGYYLQWTATQSGVVSFCVLSVTPAGHEYDVMLTSSGSYAMPTLSGSENGVVSMEVNAGDVVTIHVSIAPDQSYNYPAAEFVLTGKFE